MSNRTSETKVYEPFPPGEVPDGWPKEYVSLESYENLVTLSNWSRRNLESEIDALKRALEEKNKC